MLGVFSNKEKSTKNQHIENEHINKSNKTEQKAFTSNTQKQTTSGTSRK